MRWYRYVCGTFYGIRGLALVFLPQIMAIGRLAIFGGTWAHILWGLGAIIVAYGQFSCLLAGYRANAITRMTGRITVTYAAIFFLAILLDSLTRSHDLGGPLNWLFILSIHILMSFYWLTDMQLIVSRLSEASDRAARILQ